MGYGIEKRDQSQCIAFCMAGGRTKTKCYFQTILAENKLGGISSHAQGQRGRGNLFVDGARLPAATSAAIVCSSRSLQPGHRPQETYLDVSF